MPRAKLYAFRIANRLCPDCGAHLQETDARLCVEDAERERRHGRTLKVKKYRARWKRAYRASKARDGICQDCPAPVAPGKKRCQPHLDERAAALQLYLDRREESDRAAA